MLPNDVLPDKPTRKIRSLSDWRVTHQWMLPSSARDNPSAYPCLRCSGMRTRVKPGEQCDPVEGYKMAERIPCPECFGKAFVDLKTARRWFRRHTEDAIAKLNEWAVRNCRVRKALCQLDPPARRALISSGLRLSHDAIKKMEKEGSL